jgi:hypothetical protein
MIKEMMKLIMVKTKKKMIKTKKLMTRNLIG